jgi:hypothetical protein
MRKGGYYFHLKAVVDGTENKIEDVIKKLPGLDIDQDGSAIQRTTN